MSYRSDVADVLAEKPDATGVEIADSVGCSKKTARKWANQLRSESQDGSDVQGTHEPEGEPEAEPEPEGEPEGGERELTGGDLDGDDDEPDELELDDDEAREYTCGGCGESLRYLEKSCSGCGEQPMWSAIEGAES